jgi:hypothetical protein
MKHLKFIQMQHTEIYTIEQQTDRRIYGNCVTLTCLNFFHVLSFSNLLDRLGICYTPRLHSKDISINRAYSWKILSGPVPRGVYSNHK